ncbi:hypothetical protein HRG_013362 [Hirsutella rhossiliensis]
MMETAWAKLADYYELTEDSPVYSAATVLNPSLKWTYMEKTWEDRQEWIERAKARVGQLWRDEYKPASQCCITRPIPEQRPDAKRPNGYKIWMKEQKATIFSMDDDESWDNSALILPTECRYMDGSHDTIERVSSEA